MKAGSSKKYIDITPHNLGHFTIKNALAKYRRRAYKIMIKTVMMT